MAISFLTPGDELKGTLIQHYLEIYSKLPPWNKDYKAGKYYIAI